MIIWPFWSLVIYNTASNFSFVMPHLALDLALLGFPISPDTILFHKPNSKLLEEILYFLFRLYDPAEMDRRLGECWPITTALLAKQFRAGLLRWSEDLKRSGALPRECVLRKSWLEESVGERLEEALAHLAVFLVRRAAGEDANNSGEDERTTVSLNSQWYAMEAFLPDSHWRRLEQLYRELEQLHREAVTTPSRGEEEEGEMMGKGEIY